MIIGVHISVAGGLHLAAKRAQSLGCNAMQFFWRNPRSWSPAPLTNAEISLFRGARESAGIRIAAVHTTYLINLSSPDDAVFAKSAGLFEKEVDAADALGADYLVTHLGSHLGKGPERALGRVALAMRRTAKRRANKGGHATVLFENSAGGGNTFGSKLSELGFAVDEAEKAGIEAGFCFDTCHGFAAGYPMENKDDASALVKAVDAEAGLKRLMLIHLNDSKAPFGSRVDRHEHIGKGAIGLAGFNAFLGRAEFKRLPIILETPKESDADDRKNLKTARRLLKQREETRNV